MRSMTWRSKIEPVGQAMAAVVKHAYHYWRPKVEPPFLIWAEDGENGMSADDMKACQAITGTVDYFTKSEYDQAVDAIQKAFDDMGCAWYLSSVQFEDDTGLIHYEWAWEVA